jgi:hypothetical protein
MVARRRAARRAREIKAVVAEREAIIEIIEQRLCATRAERQQLLDAGYEIYVDAVEALEALLVDIKARP